MGGWEGGCVGGLVVGWMDGWLEKAEIKPTQPSLARAWQKDERLKESLYNITITMCKNLKTLLFHNLFQFQSCVL